MATRTVIRAGALALVAGTVAALAAACGGGGSSAGANPTPSATGVQAELAAYVKCLNQNGVTITLPSGEALPGGNFRSGRPDRSGFPTSRPDRSGFPTGRPTARPSGSFGGFGGGGGFLQKPESVDQTTWDKAIAACASVRPSFGAGGAGRGGDNGANAAYQNCLRDHGATGGSSPSAAALQACEVLKPTGAPSSSS